MTLNALVLLLHSWLRWGVLFLGLTTFWQSLTGWISGRNVSPEERHTQLAFISALDIQVLLGLALYFVLSPNTPRSLSALRMSMTNAVLRFFAIEHISAMLVALLLVHFSSVMSRRAIHPAARHRRWFLGMLFALVIIGVSIPWPFFPYGRPLYRLP